MLLTVARILAIEDSLDFQKLIRVALEADHDLHIYPNALSIIEVVSQVRPDLLLLDVDLPGRTGFEAATLLMKEESLKDIPIFFLTSHREMKDLQMGLNIGAEDYFFKPISPIELKARCESRLKSIHHKAEIQKALEGRLQSKFLVLDLISRVLFVRGKADSTQLSPLESQIMAIFMKNRGRPLSREEILEQIKEKKEARVLDNHIGSLKKKLPLLSQWIVSVYGVGYVFDESKKCQ